MPCTAGGRKFLHRIYFAAVQTHSSAIRSLYLEGLAGRLEALLNSGAENASHAALVCHPHPMFGGTLHNKVVFHAIDLIDDLPNAEGISGAGLVRVLLNGKAELKKVSIDPSLLRPEGREMIEDLVIAAHRDAKTKVERQVSEQMTRLAQDMGLPPEMMPR